MTGKTDRRERPHIFAPIASPGGWTARFCYYRHGLEQPRHDHAHAHMSFLITGCLQEVSRGRTIETVGRQAALMPVGGEHAVRYGREGALLLSIDCDDTPDAMPEHRDWLPFGEATVRKLSLVGGGDATADILGDLVAGFGTEPAQDMPALHAAPGWLRAAIQQIADAPDTPIAALAREAGVHRVHFSRCFQRHTGLSPTEFRLLRKASSAMRRTVTGETDLAGAASEAGFADQAHWSRTCRALAGIPPGQVRRMLAM